MSRRPPALVPLALLLACGDAPTSSSRPSPSPSSSLPLSALPRTPAPSSPPSSPPPADFPQPTPNRARGLAASTDNALCVDCHPDEAAEWQASLHRQSFTHPAFQASLAVEPSPFCRGCHAPEADPRAPPPDALADLGVGCVTCHVVEPGTVLAAGTTPIRETGVAPHVVLRSPAFAATGACASCHDFAFPGRSGHRDEDRMQTTVREHARSPAADRSCASCHMPRTQNGASHRFDVRAPGWLGRQLDVAARMDETGTLLVTLSRRSPAHAFPTGDLFRRLEVGARFRGDPEPRVEHLARHFVVAAGTPGRALARDDRLFFDPATIALSPLTTTEPRVDFWITYQRVAQALGGEDPSRAVVESSVPLYSGHCVWPDGAPEEARCTLEPGGSPP